MNSLFYRLPPLILAIGVAACSSGSNDAAIPPLLSMDDVDDAAAEMVNVFNLPVTHFSQVPSIGTAEYQGHSWIEVTGTETGFLLGEMTTRVNFATKEMTGTVSNFNLVDPGNNPVQPLSGTIALAGARTAEGPFTMSATGTLTSAGSGPLSGSTTADLTYAGNFRRDTLPADHIYGTISGSLDGSMGLSLGSGSNFYGVLQP